MNLTKKRREDVKHIGCLNQRFRTVLWNRADRVYIEFVLSYMVFAGSLAPARYLWR